MAYQVMFAGPALLHLNGLPGDAFDALVDRVVALVDQPWDATVAWPGDDSFYRETAFGDGRGFIGFYLDEAAKLIRIYRVVWAG
jgi:hypothetical protein